MNQMGHREDKQRARRQRIIANAVALYREVGPGTLRIREIAARTGISDATFFNYFKSQDAIFREWAEDVVDAAFSRAAARCQAGEGTRRAMRGLSLDLANEIELQGEALVTGFRSIGAVPRAVAARPGRGRTRQPDGAMTLVEAALARGEIRADLPATQLAEMLRSVVVSALAHGVDMDRTPSATALAQRVRLASDVLLDGMRKRNERVKMNSNPSLPAAP